jgi:hypothetical protein
MSGVRSVSELGGRKRWAALLTLYLAGALLCRSGSWFLLSQAEGGSNWSAITMQALVREAPVPVFQPCGWLRPIVVSAATLDPGYETFSKTGPGTFYRNIIIVHVS